MSSLLEAENTTQNAATRMTPGWNDPPPTNDAAVNTHIQSMVINNGRLNLQKLRRPVDPSVQGGLQQLPSSQTAKTPPGALTTPVSAHFHQSRSFPQLYSPTGHQLSAAGGLGTHPASAFSPTQAGVNLLSCGNNSSYGQNAPSMQSQSQTSLVPSHHQQQQPQAYFANPHRNVAPTTTTQHHLHLHHSQPSLLLPPTAAAAPAMPSAAANANSPPTTMAPNLPHPAAMPPLSTTMTTATTAFQSIMAPGAAVNPNPAMAAATAAAAVTGGIQQSAAAFEPNSQHHLLLNNPPAVPAPVSAAPIPNPPPPGFLPPTPGQAVQPGQAIQPGQTVQNGQAVQPPIVAAVVDPNCGGGGNGTTTTMMQMTMSAAAAGGGGAEEASINAINGQQQHPMFFSPPNIVPMQQARPTTQPMPNNYRVPVKAAGDVSLSGPQLSAFLTKATLLLPQGPMREGIQLRINQFGEFVQLGQISAPCLKKLNFVVDAIDRHVYEEAWQFLDQMMLAFPADCAQGGWAHGIRLLVQELRNHNNSGNNTIPTNNHRANSAGARHF